MFDCFHSALVFHWNASALCNERKFLVANLDNREKILKLASVEYHLLFIKNDFFFHHVESSFSLCSQFLLKLSLCSGLVTD